MYSTALSSKLNYKCTGFGLHCTLYCTASAQFFAYIGPLFSAIWLGHTWCIATDIIIIVFSHHKYVRIQCNMHNWLRRSVRSCSQTIPEALAKIWWAAGSKVKAFSYMVRKLRSIAFQRCIWRGGLPLVEMAENEDFLQKKVWKTAF